MARTELEIDGPADGIDAQAAIWWSRLELGTADQRAFEHWRDADASHAVAFARVQASWERLAAHDLAVATGPLDATRLSRRHFLRAGATGVVCLMAGGAFYTSRAMAWDRASTGVGEYRRIALPDASMLELNTDTEVSWHFTKRARKIRLDRGEIAMALVEGAPATLLTSDTRLVLSPGRFNARLSGTQVGLTVLTGKARLDPQAFPLPLATEIKTGQAAQLSPAGISVQPTSAEKRALITAWQSGDIVFDDEPLQKAVDEYNRYLPSKISVDARLQQQRVGGRFTTSDPNAFLRAVALALDADVKSRENGVQIIAKN